MERKLLDMMNQLSISEYNPRMKYCDKFQFVESRKSEFKEVLYEENRMYNAMYYAFIWFECLWWRCQ